MLYTYRNGRLIVHGGCGSEIIYFHRFPWSFVYFYLVFFWFSEIFNSRYLYTRGWDDTVLKSISYVKQNENIGTQIITGGALKYEKKRFNSGQIYGPT